MMTRNILRVSLCLCLASLSFLPAFSQSVTVSPTSISFSNQAQGSTSPVGKVTLKNGQTSAITISSISTNLADYSQTNTCPASPATLAAGASCTISITFTPSAQGSRSGTLTVVDTGLSSPQLVTLTGTGTAPVLQSIAVTPSAASVTAGISQQFTATGTYSDGSTQSLTTTASWTSSSNAIATVGSHTGLAKGVAAGTATIKATSGKITGSATLTVTAAVLISIAVTPTTASVAAGKTKQFIATGTYNNGTTQTLTSTATWISSATAIATVSSGGLATGVSQGSATITASSGTISGSATMTVTAATLTSIAVTPNPASVAVGITQQFKAMGTYSDATTKDLTTTANWTSSAPSVATIPTHTGLATSIAVGTATITASVGATKGSATLTVTPAALVAIAVTPGTTSIAAGNTVQFTATGTYSDSTTQNLTSTCVWTSSATSVATVSGGLATGMTQGTATITATSGTISGSATLTVGVAALLSIVVTPANPSFALGTTLPLKATGTYSDGSTLDLTATVTWSTSNPAIATVNNQGIASSIALGTTTVTATSGTITGSTNVTVTAATLVSITVTPAVPTVALGTKLQFTATGTYTDGSTQNITSTVQWSSDTPSVATISNDATTAGLATSAAQGTATISATSGSVTYSTTLAVTAAALASIAITPPAPWVALGGTQQFTATATYSDGSSQNITAAAQWSSDTPSVATISNDTATVGLATTVGPGTATITAVSGSVTGSTELTVTTVTLVSIAVNPSTASVALGTTQQFTATGTYADSSTQDLTRSGHWSSSDATVATISNTTSTAGLASTLGAGTTTIQITAGSVTGTATLVVNPAALASLAISPTSPTITLGTTRQFSATGTYTDGTTQDLTTVAAWSSSDATIATIGNSVGSYGLASGAGVGTATITATASAQSTSTALNVSPPAMASLSSATLIFGNQSLGTTSGVQTVTLSNTGGAPLIITSIVASGDFSQSNTCGSSVSAGANCSIGVAFTPLTTGTRTGSVIITDSASNSPQMVILTGTGQIASFQHVIVIIQENRTPDNLFQGLCSPPFGTSTSCNTSPTSSQYNIQTSNWLDKTSPTGITPPTLVPFVNSYDLAHTHIAFTSMCDMNALGVCQMDGAAGVTCVGTCPTLPQYAYVDNSTSILNPYLTLATEYGWANYMFQTNQGPSFPAHQFLFGGTSARSAADDAIGTFVAENVNPTNAAAGCIAAATTIVRLITPQGESQYVYPCFDHQTMADLFDSDNISWKYYTESKGSIWTAPNAIQHLCVPSAPTGGSCTGSDWTNNVIIKPAQVLTDIGNCNLPQMSWVIPGGANSDHPNSNRGGGPSWVASIVDAIGSNPLCNNGELYWNNTAILITWDDWGGWYDHEPPNFLSGAQGDYQFGFRVPFLVVSAYTPAGFVDNNRMDFGSILRFVEQNFGITEGALNFADARATNDLTEFFDLQQAPRPFQTVAAPLDANYFLNDKTPPTDPDDD